MREKQNRKKQTCGAEKKKKKKKKSEIGNPNQGGGKNENPQTNLNPEPDSFAVFGLFALSRNLRLHLSPSPAAATTRIFNTSKQHNAVNTSHTPVSTSLSYV